MATHGETARTEEEKGTFMVQLDAVPDKKTGRTLYGCPPNQGCTFKAVAAPTKGDSNNRYLYYRPKDISTTQVHHPSCMGGTDEQVNYAPRKKFKAHRVD